MITLKCERKGFFSDASDVVNLIAYAEKNHWFGGKKLFFNLDISKTIFNRQTKLVLHNSSKLEHLHSMINSEFWNLYSL